MTRRRHPDPNWASLAFDSWSLAAESSMVIGMRMMKLGAGGAAAQAEAGRMVAEKIDAAFDLQMLALTGGLGTTLESASGHSIDHYRKRVRANHRRLSRG